MGEQYNQSEAMGNNQSQYSALGGIAAQLQTHQNIPQSANLNSAFAESTLYPHMKQGERLGANEGQSTNFYRVQTNAQNNPLTSLKIDFHSKVEASAAMDLLSKKLTQKVCHFNLIVFIEYFSV